MFRPLVFGGTTEGRAIAEFCAENGVGADVSVATEYGASLLPEGVGVLCGRLGAEEIAALIREKAYSVVVDATHPYAAEVTKNIKLACESAGTRYLRLVRESSAAPGETVSDYDELVELLNASEGTILSSLGGKSLPELTRVKNYRERLWIRMLPAEDAVGKLRGLGYDTDKAILEKGPFSVERNEAHLRKSGASILVAKESGAAGGYPEKAEAARNLGVRLITLARPRESGYSYDEIIGIIRREAGL